MQRLAMTSTVCVISCQKREKEKHGSFSQGQGKVPGRWSELCCNVTASHDLHFLHGLMSKEEGEQAWLLLTRARQSPGSLCSRWSEWRTRIAVAHRGKAKYLALCGEGGQSGRTSASPRSRPSAPRLCCATAGRQAPSGASTHA